VKKTFKALWPYLRIVLSLLLLWLAARNIDWQALRQTNIAIYPGWFILALTLLVFANILPVVRWSWIMRSMGLHQPISRCITLYFAGGLINQGLPSTIGGDSYRALEASRSTTAARRSDDQALGTRAPTLSEELHQPVDLNRAPPRLRLGFISVALDRGLGLIGNNILGALGLIMGGAMIAPWGESLGWWVLGTMLAGVALASQLLSVSRTRLWIQKIFTTLGMPEAMPGLNTALGWPTVVPQLAISLCTHILAITAFWCCLQAFGTTAPFSALMVGLPALGLLMMLPISISGWGLREATLSTTLVLWGVDSGITVLASVSFGIVTLVTYLPGAISLLERRRQDDLSTKH
jgi:uncharacterized membrane protein YbhN (UPF0104 family)